MAESGVGTIIFEGGPSCCGSFSSWCRKTRWRITTTYIEREKGVCCPAVENLQLLRVKDLGYKSTCCCSCCGTITVYSSDETNPVLTIAGIPGSRDVYEKIRDAVSNIQSNAKLELSA